MKKKLSQILKVCNEIKACTWSEWNPQISLRKAEEITPQNLALSLPYFEFLCMIVKPGGFMQVTNPWLSMKNLFSLFLSPPRNKATQTIFVMTKVYIFAIAKHHSTASFFFLYWKKIEKILSQKKKNRIKKDLKKGKAKEMRNRDTKWQFSDFHPSITKPKNYEIFLAFFSRPIIYHKLSFLSLIMLKSDRILESCSFVMMIMSM